jgi:serine/threonine-protein kinase MRCK
MKFIPALVHPENQLNAFLMYSGVDAWRVIEIQSSQSSGGYAEFLLVFQTLAIYVDIQGRKSRDREIMYPAVPTYICKFLFNNKLPQIFN